jgi:gamma-D-glutamyl-L-lysine dipeptidyl-peptidase
MSPFEPHRAIVRVPVVSFQTDPSADAEVKSQAIYGSVVQVIETASTWARIVSADGTPGWAPESALCREDESQANGSPILRVRGLFAHLYREPAACRQPPILTLPFEAVLAPLPATEAKERWTHVGLVGGATAWIQNEDVEAAERTLSIAELVSFAPQFVGLPFMWGGTTTYGYDCSGFIQMLCRQRGLAFPRRLARQVEWLAAHGVSPATPMAGDLALFGSDGETVTHIALMLSGERFVHSTVTGRPIVQVSALTDEPWPRRLLAFWRIADEPARTSRGMASRSLNPPVAQGRA